MAPKRATRKSRVITKIEKARTPNDASDSEEEKFDKGFSFVGNAADYNFDTWKSLTQLVEKKEQKASLSETIRKVVGDKVLKGVSSFVTQVTKEQRAQLDDELNEICDTLKERQKLQRRKKAQNTLAQEDDKIPDQSGDFHGTSDVTFQNMDLSRPLVKALTAMNFASPTPIQKSALPVALGGRDVYACAATGTGKTAAFMLPVLERLLYRPVIDVVTRVLVIVPTRELSLQVYQVALQLAQFTNINIALASGGLDLKMQESYLRRKPDVIIATPGRLIDHLQNTPSFSLHAIEVIILDEADKLLEDQFAEQLKEIIKQCSPTRQTMLFSATMNDRVRDLANLSLSNPVRLFLNKNTDVALNLRQEFIRIRSRREGEREPLLCALVTRYFNEHTIVFVQTKKLAHRIRILFELIGIRVEELHSSLSQTQRIEALKKFTQQEVDVLVTTDLSARGLDIQNVQTVINYTLPPTLQQYVHRVGRTARAGKVGRSVSMVGEQERKVLKEIVKKARTPVKQRVIDSQVIATFKERIESVAPDIANILRQEKMNRDMQEMEKSLDKVNRKLKKATQPRLKRESDLELQRNWFQTTKERNEEKKKLRLGKHTKLDGKKGVKIPDACATAESRVQWELQKAAAYQARCAKKFRKLNRLHTMVDSDDDNGEPTKEKLKTKRTGNDSKKGITKTLTATERAQEMRRLPPKEQIRQSQVKKNGSGKGFKSKKKFKRR
ncbi:putative ATP-dependent RNA helicase DDX27-like [Tropilaelaps mercedesae]|uniref:RNA helicase n=1 Tax=Tropilaelaps mercedesae TaxID=418985 RepID=A0A1V9Y3M9_9ACAR|nr:putative ATP-dependent RNA helicase DDX27-like [Tropilaelaps mercedesae]